MRISRTVMAVGGVVLAAGLIGFTNPKAVHALTAALVQVTNTASNPVVTQGVGAQAGNMVHLLCGVTLDDSPATCQQVGTNGNGIHGMYTVPTAESLVVTAVDVQPLNNNTCTGSGSEQVADQLNLGTQTSTAYFLRVSTTNAVFTTHILYPSGVAIDGGSVPTIRGNIGFGDGTFVTCPNAEEVLNIYGYLTAA